MASVVSIAKNNARTTRTIMFKMGPVFRIGRLLCGFNGPKLFFDLGHQGRSFAERGLGARIQEYIKVHPHSGLAFSCAGRRWNRQRAAGHNPLNGSCSGWDFGKVLTSMQSGTVGLIRQALIRVAIGFAQLPTRWFSV
jgi:hypothetical protein